MSGNRINIRIIFLSLFITSSILLSQDKSSIAVLPLEENGISPSEAMVLTDELRSVLVQSGKYIVVERSNMESILQEQGFQLSGCTSTECAVEAGRLLGVQKMVAGSVGKLGELFNISIRMFDVESGQIEKTVSEKHEGSVEELLYITNKLGNELASSVVSIPQDSKQSQNQNRIEHPGSYLNKNKLGIWFSINMPRTSVLSEVGQGYGMGLYYKINILQSLFLQPEISYSTSRLEYYEPEDILRFEFFHLTALISYEIIITNVENLFLNIDAGITLNSILGAQQEYEGYVSDLKSQVRESTTSMIFGVGIGIHLGKIILTIAPRYERGLETIFKDDVSWEVGKGQTFYITIGAAL